MFPFDNRWSSHEEKPIVLKLLEFVDVWVLSLGLGNVVHLAQFTFRSKGNAGVKKTCGLWRG